ncbi:xylulokinase [Bacillus dakarensis]|uniref:xylulokinase n=1 Tax=Robertmurraya dakarensis TaxID=1926278 RepID=UPI000981DBEC|nr:FGGY family carbohydrate kinase [Bacillus dakarensis]
MSYIAVFDLGTTAIKGVLVSRDGQLHFGHALPIETKYGYKQEIEQNPEQWWERVQCITRQWFSEDGVSPETIEAVTFSGQMEDVILIKEGEPATNAILYSDQRAAKEAELIQQKIPQLSEITGNGITSSTPLAKLLWLKEHEQDEKGEEVHVVFSAKDYLIYKLTGRIVTDIVTAATTGMMNLQTRKWHADLLSLLHIEEFVLPNLLSPEEKAGKVSTNGASQTGFLENTPVLCGAGDAGASTLGAGAILEGDCYMYLGTTGWIAGPTKDYSPQDNGVFTLAHIVPDLNIGIAPLLNAGNVHDWAMKTFLGCDDYDALEEEMQKSPPGANSLFFLPYLHGERCPIHDSDAKGAFWGIGPETKKADFLRAALEGICFSLLQITEMLVGSEVGSIALIGGGANSKTWCQMISDMTNKTVRVPHNTEYLPSLGIGATAFKYLGWTENYRDFVEEYIASSANSVNYYPNAEHHELYAELYKKYKKLYPSMEKMYR